MSFYNALFDEMLDAAAGVALVASLHTAQPDASGSSEVAGSGYARQSVTWGTAASGSVSSTAIPTFTVPASTTVTHVGFWDSGETTFYGSTALDTPESFGAAGELTVDPATITAANPA